MTVDVSRSCLGLETCVGMVIRQIVDARVLPTATAPPALPGRSMSDGSLARLVPGIWNPHRGQLGRPVQLGRAGGIPPVGLDPVARPLRDQRGGNHHGLTGEARLGRALGGIPMLFLR